MCSGAETIKSELDQEKQVVGVERKFGEVRYISPEEAIFRTTDGGVLTLQIDDNFYSKVDVYQAFPLSLENKFISIRNEKDEEIGVIKDLADFDQESREAVLEEIQWRYYTPKIKRILSTKEEYGHMYWDVETDRGFRKFVTRGRDQSILPISNTRILIIDMTGNRFEIPNYRELDQKSFRYIESLV